MEWLALGTVRFSLHRSRSRAGEQCEVNLILTERQRVRVVAWVLCLTSDNSNSVKKVKTNKNCSLSHGFRWLVSNPWCAADSEECLPSHPACVLSFTITLACKGGAMTDILYAVSLQCLWVLHLQIQPTGLKIFRGKKKIQKTPKSKAWICQTPQIICIIFTLY